MDVKARVCCSYRAVNFVLSPVGFSALATYARCYTVWQGFAAFVPALHRRGGGCPEYGGRVPGGPDQHASAEAGA